MAQRWRKRPGKQKAARKGVRKLKTIAGRLIRELERKLAEEALKRNLHDCALYRRVLNQKPKDRNKIYSLHEPHAYCISKGKEHKKYEFGCKASIVMTKTHGIIVAATSHQTNVYDGHTLPEVLEFAEVVTGVRPNKAIVDRGYRGRRFIGSTEVLVPQRPHKDQSRATSSKMRQRFRRRAAIEPVISHLKHDHRMARCYLKGQMGDAINVKLAVAAWNLKKWMREVLSWLQIPHTNPIIERLLRTLMLT